MNQEKKEKCMRNEKLLIAKVADLQFKLDKAEKQIEEQKISFGRKLANERNELKKFKSKCKI